MGRRHFVGCFAAVGAAPIACETPEAFDEAAGALVGESAPALVLLDQRFAECEQTVEALRSRGMVVLLLPGEPTEGHPALDSIRALIEVAAGANILGEY